LYQCRLLLLFEFVNIYKLIRYCFNKHYILAFLTLLKDEKIVKKWIGLAFVAWALSETRRAQEGLRVLEVMKFFLGEYFIPLLL
jgi:hypothetical protein